MTTTASRNGQADVPAAVEAEEHLLACCLLGPDALAWATANLAEGDFYRPAHRVIFAVLAELHSQSQPVDAGVLVAALAERNALPELGGAPAIAHLATLQVTPANVGYFARPVLATSRLRRLADVGGQIALLGRTGEVDDPDRALAAARGLLDDLERSTAAQLAGPVEILHEMLAARELEEAGARVMWGLADLDRLTGGLPPRQLVVLGARPGQGKSSLALQLALQASAGRRVLFGSYEMGLSEIGQHHLAALGRVTIDQALSEIASPELAGAREEYQRRDFAVLDGNPSLERFCAQVAGLHARTPYDLVVVDYLQLMPVDGRYERRDLEVGAISRALKRLALRCSLPVLALASLTRDAEGQMPTLRHLRDSGAVEADADQVIFLHEQPAETDDERRQREHEEFRIVDAEVAKHRMGAKGRASLYFDEPRTVFSDLAPGWQAARDPSNTRA